MAAPPITERHKPHFHRKAPFLESVRAATTANITIATALNNGDSLDGVTLATGDRVLVKNQTTGSQNGIYVVGATPVRDYDVSTDDPAFGYLVYVREGTTNGGTVWKNTNTSAPTIDTTSLTYSQFGSVSSLAVTDEGVSLDSAVTSIDFTGAGVVATNVGHAVTVTIAGATSSGEHEHMVDGFTGDGSTTSFELTDEPVDAEMVVAFVNGSETAVTISGGMSTTATFGAAPGAGQRVTVMYPAVVA